MEIHGYAALTASTKLQPFSYNTKELSPFEILVKITHSGLCHTDLYMIDNAWKRSTYPLLPGHEIVGTIIDSGSLSEKKVGTRISLSWVRSSCLTCPQCLENNTNICPSKTSLYNNGHFGGFADHIVADSRFCYTIPATLDSAHAAPLLCAGATVYAPLINHKIQAKMSIGIIGIGGLGHLALQFSKALKCTVSALSNNPSKKQDAKKFGADHFYTPDTPPKPSQFDFLLSTTDAPLDWNKHLSYLKPNGTLCFVSRPPAGIFIDPTHLVSTQRTVCGSNNANRPIMNEMLAFSAKHNIKAQIEEMPLSQINEGIAKLRANKVRYRIVFNNAR